MSPTTLIPVSTWDQIGVIIIFALVLGSMSGGFYAILRSLIKIFQDFITARDKLWQEHAEKREAEYNARNSIVVTAIQSLAETIKDMSEQNQVHHTVTVKAIAKMEERTRPISSRWQKPDEDEGKAGGD